MPGAQFVECLRAHSEELLDVRLGVGEQERLSQARVVRGHRPGGVAAGQMRAEAQERDIGRLPVRMRSAALQVGALDEPDVDPGVGERVDIAWRAREVGLERGSQP